MANRITLPEFKQKVLKIIKDRNEQLEKLFEERKYRKMPGEFTLHSRIVTHEGDVILGRDSENYWRRVGKDSEGTNLNFKDPRLEARELTVSPAHHEEEYDFVAFEITEFTFKAKGKTYNGYIDPPYRHRVICDID